MAAAPLVESYVNSAYTTLNGAINNAVTSLVVPTATGFPISGQYRILIDAEIMLVTGGQGSSTWTVTRNIEGSIAASHLNGAPVRFILTAASLQELQWKDKVVIPSSAGNILDDEFDDASLDSAWVRVDNATDAANVTWTESSDILSMKNTGAGASLRYHALMKPLGAISFPITIEIATRHFSQYAVNYFMFGVMFSDGVTYGSGKQIQTRPYTTASIATALRLSTTTNTGFNTELTYYESLNYQTMGGPFFHRLIWSAANTFQTWFSPDGVSWFQNSVNIPYTITPTYAGIATSNWGTNMTTIGSIEYFRVFTSDKAGNP